MMISCIAGNTYLYRMVLSQLLRSLYSVNSGDNLNIDNFPVCQKPTNSLPISIFCELEKARVAQYVWSWVMLRIINNKTTSNAADCPLDFTIILYLLHSCIRNMLCCCKEELYVTAFSFEIIEQWIDIAWIQCGAGDKSRIFHFSVAKVEGDS